MLTVIILFIFAYSVYGYEIRAIIHMDITIVYLQCDMFANILRWDGVLASIIMEHAGMIYFCSVVCYLIKLSYVISG